MVTAMDMAMAMEIKMTNGRSNMSKKPFPKFKAAVLALASLGVALVAFLQSSALYAERTNPAGAAARAPWDGAMLASLAKAGVAAELQTDSSLASGSSQFQALALDAYVKQPLSPSALATLAAVSEEGIKADLFEAVAQISRRDFVLQGLLLQHHSAQSNLPKSLAVLNQLLLVRVSQRPMVFDAFKGALLDPSSIEPFAGVLDTNPIWGDDFLVAAAKDSAVLTNLAVLRGRLDDENVAPETDKALALAFAANGNVSEAFRLYENTRSADDEQTGWISDIAPFDWALTDERGFSARSQNSETLTVRIQPGKGGVFARRLVEASALPNRLVARHAFSRQEQLKDLYLAISCADTGTEIARSSFDIDRVMVEMGDKPEACQFFEIAFGGRAWSGRDAVAGSLSPLE